MKKIYLITQQCYEVDKPSYLQHNDEVPLYAVDTIEKAKKEIEFLKKDEEERFASIKDSACRWEYDYKVINLFESKKGWE